VGTNVTGHFQHMLTLLLVILAVVLILGLVGGPRYYRGRRGGL
jgi:hypothetical protein